MGKVIKLKGLHLQSSILGFIEESFRYVYKALLRTYSSQASTGAKESHYFYNSDGILSTYANFVRILLRGSIERTLQVGVFHLVDHSVTILASKTITAIDLANGYVLIDFDMTKFDSNNILVIGAETNNPSGDSLSLSIAFQSMTGISVYSIQDGVFGSFNDYCIGYDYGIKETFE